MVLLIINTAISITEMKSLNFSSKDMTSWDITYEMVVGEIVNTETVESIST